MADTVALRHAGKDDVAGIVSLLNAAFAMEWDFINRARTSAPEIEQYMTTGTFFVRDGEDGAIGACMYLEQRVTRLYLGMLAVSPAMQGRGIGKQMMAAAEHHASSLGCDAIDIRIVNRRAELPPFYRALGFVDNGTELFEDPLLTKPCHFIRMTKRVEAR
jgi:GNAT superfamily N-acetyltransferase